MLDNQVCISLHALLIPVDDDYRAAEPLNVTFYLGRRGAAERARIAAVNDNIAEGDEEFTVSIDSTYPPTAPGTPASQTATILASDRKSKVFAGVEVSLLIYNHPSVL